MQGLSIDHNLIHFLLVIMAALLVIQAYVLLRIRNILQAIAMNFDSVIYFWRKYVATQEHGTKKAAAGVPQMAKTCQFCKHRLAYINTSKSSDDEENFYYRCGLRNINVSLRDSCTHFEQDAITAGDE